MSLGPRVAGARSAPALFLAAVVCLWPAAAGAHHLDVLNTNDALAGSLRQAVLDSAPDDSIVFDPATWGGTITLSTGAIAVTHNLSITGPQRSLVILAASGTNRVFNLTAGNLTLAAMTLTNPGSSAADQGGLVQANAASTQLVMTDCDLLHGFNAGHGGLLYNVGTTTLLRCRLSSGASTGGSGGGVYTKGGFTATDCTFDNCSADSGGAISSAGKLRLLRCTFSGNVGVGAAVQLPGGADSTALLECTISANGGASPALSNGGAVSVYVGGTALAANAGGDASGAFHSLGFNAIGDSTGATGFSPGAHDIIGVSAAKFNPHLGGLQDNGGPTPTLMPLTDSQLIDSGHSMTADTLDARGRLRRYDYLPAVNGIGTDLADIGAVEFQPKTHLTVTNLFDHGPGSLRQKMLLAAPLDTVTFDPSVGGTIGLTTGELVIPRSMYLLGPGPNALILDGGGVRPVLAVTHPPLSVVSVSVQGLHLVHGGVTAALDIANGAAISTDLMAITDSRTSGIRNAGALAVTRSLIAGCNAAAPPPNVESDGGGVLMVNGATLSMLECTLAADTASNGGGISNPGGTIELHGTTIATNVTVGTTAGTRQGGGIRNGGVAYLGSTLVAGNKGDLGGPDLFGNFTSLTGNLVGISDGSGGLLDGVNGNQVGTAASPLDPKLGPLADNGGPTLSMLPLAGSPAIDHGVSFALSTDQRERERVFDDPAVANGSVSEGSDVGAVERGAATVDVSPSPAADARPAVDRIDAVAPNPSVGRCAVSFTLARAGAIDLGLYDVAGRRVAALAHASFAAGPHALTWDGGAARALPAGLYWLRLGTVSGTTTRRLVRVR